MAHPKKQIQTLVNKLARVALGLQAGKANVQAVRDLYQAANPPVGGTIIEGRVAAINAWVNALIALANDPVTQELVSKANWEYGERGLG